MKRLAVKLACIVPVIVVLGSPVTAQISDIAALRARVPDLRDSTERVALYARLGMLYTNRSLDSCYYFGARALDLAKRIHDKSGETEALNVLAYYYQEKAKVVIERTQLQLRRAMGITLAVTCLLTVGFSLQLFHSYRNKRRLAKRQKEINGRLEEQYRQLEDNNAFHQKLISIISHDLRQPLSSMLMLGEGGMVEQMSDSQRQYVFNQISQNARTSLQAMDGLVHWMKLNTMGLAYKPSTVNLKGIILAALAYNQTVADQKGIVVMDFIPSTIGVLAQSEMLLFVNRNILSNALRHTPKGGRIVISVVKDEETNNAVVRIADSGSGIPSNLLPHLFDKVRSDKASGGSGLALIICHEMIERMHGRIWANNNPEGGASFCYTLPLGDQLDKDMPLEQPSSLESQTQSID